MPRIKEKARTPQTTTTPGTFNNTTETITSQAALRVLEPQVRLEQEPEALRVLHLEVRLLGLEHHQQAELQRAPPQALLGAEANPASK